MYRNERNLRINSAINDSDERSYMISISGVLGDSEIVDIDYDDLSEATGITDLSVIEELLQVMYDMNIIENLDFEEGTMG